MPAIQNVVVAVHDSPAGARVVELVSVQAAVTGARLVLVSPYQVRGSRAKLVLERAAETCAEMGAPTVETAAVAGDPARVLLDAAREHSADMLAVGNQGLSSAGGRLAGSVAGEVIARAGCDVFVVHTTSDRWHKLVSPRHRRKPSTYQRKFVVGVHDTPHSMRAAERAGQLAADLDAELLLVGAYARTEEWHQAGGRKPQTPRQLGSTMDALGVEDSHLAQADLAAIDSALTNAQARARAQGARKVSTVSVPGDPVHALLDIAYEREADMIVVGNTPHARGSARLLGSISSQVSRKAPMHVLLVR